MVPTPRAKSDTKVSTEPSLASLLVPRRDVKKKKNPHTTQYYSNKNKNEVAY